ncbi:interleukin-13 receptor subunit alpha-1 isoform X1 [Hippoglossus hippoglossus]|uniref:interleukin-13 receptor subunit alpha-1 isoform X1 n=1 Tax=Hippoglossus hippoglossus TaxID=8267 RepID=UPI00148E84B4|nr:interleukin-13 receptor subunit alpha-1 isoform X1 [Hippoglossus hippoglossus]
MTVTPGLLAALTLSAMLTVSRCDAENQLPPPTNLSLKWLDEFAVNMSWSWEKPESLPDQCKITYVLVQEQRLPEKKEVKLLTWRNHIENCVTENMDSDHCTYTVRAICEPSYAGWSPSTFVNETAKRKEPRAELVRDFQCLITQDALNCSWIPVNPSLNLTISYRACLSTHNNGSLKACVQPYSTGTRNGCYVKEADIYICIYIESKIGWSYIKPGFAIPSPDLRIREDNKHLKLTWSPPKFGEKCIWIYELCHTQCSEPRKCRNFTYTHSNQNETPSNQNEMPYNRHCRYEFRSRWITSKYCTGVVGFWSEIVPYGTDNPPDRTLTYAAIIIPTILFVCIILSCYCFRKHSDIICPNTPDPSAIFKEMVMSGNKEHKQTENLYTPMPEAVESCKVTLINQSGAPQENS